MSFPVTGILDNTTRADETPLSDGGKWTSGATGLTSTGLQLVSNQIRDHDLGARNESYWNNATFGPDIETYFTVNRIFQVGNTDDFYLYGRLTNPGASASCFLVDFINNASSFNVISVTVYKEVSGTFTPLHTFTNLFTLAVNDQIGISIIGTTVTIYQNGTSLNTFSDGSITGSGFIGMGTNFTTADACRFSAFGGGTSTDTPELFEARMHVAVP